MKLLDKILPMKTWEVFINGTSLGLYHARTAWGARRFHRLVAKPVPIPTEVSLESVALFSAIAEHDGFTAEAAHKDFGHLVERNVFGDEVNRVWNERLGLHVPALVNSPEVKSSKPAPLTEDEMKLAKAYQADIEYGLNWNMENSTRLSKWVVIEVSYTKTAKGKTSELTDAIGVVPVGLEDLMLEWLRTTEFRTNQGISNLKFSGRRPYVNWMKMRHVVSDDDVLEKHGELTDATAPKKIKAL